MSRIAEISAELAPPRQPSCKLCVWLKQADPDEAADLRAIAASKKWLHASRVLARLGEEDGTNFRISDTSVAAHFTDHERVQS